MNNQIRILIVEDEGIIAFDLKRILERLNYQVIGILSRGEDVIGTAASENPDIILMDIMLSGKMTGIQASEEIKNKLNIPVIYLTAFADTNTLNKAKITEPFGYIIKPFDERTIVSTIEIALYKYKLDNQLKESEKRYRDLVELSPVGITIVSNRKVVYVNPSAVKIFGAADKEELLNRSLFDFFPDENRGRIREVISKVLQEQVSYSTTDEKLFAMNGRILSVEYTVIPILYNDKKAAQVVLRDITKELEYTKSLTQLNESKDKFFSVISHDLKSPFNSILGYTELLKNEYETLSDEEAKTYIESIYSSTRNLYNHINDLLEFSRFQSGSFDFDPSYISVKEWLHRNIEALSGNFLRKDVRVLLEIPNDSTLFADEYMMDSIIQNLLTNAIKFSPRGAEIKVNSSVKNGIVQLKIIDHGVGISNQILQNLFDIHKKVTAPGTENEKGTGLGLILTKEFVEKNDGTITLKSVLNKGTEVTLTFPYHKRKKEKGTAL